MDVGAIQAGAAATAATYRSFAGATRSVLDLLERHKPGCAVYMAHLDRGQFIHRIVDVRGGGDFNLRSNQALPLGDAFCSHMSEGRGPRLCGDVARHEVYGRLAMQPRGGGGAYLGVRLELAVGRGRAPATRSTGGSRCSSGSGRAPTSACRWTSPTARGSAPSPGCHAPRT